MAFNNQSARRPRPGTSVTRPAVRPVVPAAPAVAPVVPAVPAAPAVPQFEYTVIVTAGIAVTGPDSTTAKKVETWTVSAPTAKAAANSYWKGKLVSAK